MATTPGTHPLIYRSINIGGRDSPGTVVLSGHERSPVKWETQRPKGSTGAFTVAQGSDPASFTASFFLATLEDVEAWDEFQRHLESSLAGPKPQSMAVFHPDLVRNRIVDVVVDKIGGFKHDGKNGATVDVKFLEYRPAKPKAATKPGQRAGAQADTAGQRVDPNAAAKRELAALLEQARRP